MAVRVLARIKADAAVMARAIAGRVADEMMTSRARTVQILTRAGIQLTKQIAQPVLIAGLLGQKVAANSSLINLRIKNLKATGREASVLEMIDLMLTPQKKASFRTNLEAKDHVMISLAGRISKKISQKGLIKSVPPRQGAHAQIMILKEVHAVIAGAKTGFMKNVHAQIGRVPIVQIETSSAAMIAHLKSVSPMMASQKARASPFVLIAARVVGAQNVQLLKRQLKAAHNARQMEASCA